MDYPGVVIGIVKDLDDPKGEGRIRLEFPWLETGQLSSWAPIAAPLGGRERGFWFMPVLDDEVLVAFAHGKFEHPYVVGCLWNGANKPPDTDPDHRVVVTPGKHELRFEDNEGATRLILKSASGHTITLDDAGKTITVETSGRARLAMSDVDGSIEMQAGGRMIALRANQVQIS